MFDSVKKWMGSMPVWQSPSWRAASGMPVALSGRKQRYASPEESEGLTAVYRSCSILADSLASLPLRLERTPASGGREVVADSDAARCIGDLPYELKEALLYSTALTGNGYALIHRNERGGLEALSWIASWRVSVEVDEETAELTYRVLEDTNLAEPERLYAAEDMLHLKYRLSGRHPHYGVSPVVTLSPALAVCLQTREAQEMAFRNVAAPGAYLTTENKLGKEGAARLKKMWDSAFSGDSGDRGKTAILDNGLEVKNLPIAEMLSMQLEELSRFNISEVSRAFGIPLSLLSEVSSVNYSTAAEETRSLVSMTLAPWSKRVQSCLDHSLLTKDRRLSGVGFRFDMQQLLLGSGVERIEYFSKGVNGGLLTVSEARNELGYGSLRGGDTLRAPANTYPLPAWLESKPKGDTQPEASADQKGLHLVKGRMRQLAQHGETASVTPLQNRLREISQ